MHPTGNLRLAERLEKAGLVSAERREAALNQQRILGGRIEEALLDTGALSEGELLKFVAAELKTRFVSAEKLAKADVPHDTLALVPAKLAEQAVVFPVLYDTDSKQLSVVTPDPDDLSLLGQLQMTQEVKQVRALVGRPLAVKAAVAKHYAGDIHAFAMLDRGAHEQFTNMLNVFERNLVTEESMAVSLAGESRKERVISPDELKAGGQGVNVQGLFGDSYLETLNVLVSLLENGRSDLRGHSSHVARLMKRICERIGLPAADCAALQMAAYLHDLGKMSAYHLTALNVSEYDGHRAAAKKNYRAPERLLDAVKLPVATRTALASMYERFDGKGIPGEQSKKDIPLGARLLAIVDSYADLTQNPRNPFRKTLRPAQACEVLARYKLRVFDPNLIDLFKHMVTGENLKARLLANLHVALLIEPDPEESTVIELRMVEHGFEVRIARTAEAALKQIDSGEVHIVVSEVELGRHDGFALLEEAKKRPAGEKVPWVFLSSRSARSDAQRAFELGANDYITKPVSADVLVAKLVQIMERDAMASGNRGVAGSLQEMGLTEIVQVLWHGRKTGALKVRSGRANGELHFVGGHIYNALWENLRGAEACYAMLSLTTGDFLLDPNVEAKQRLIEQSPEALLLEGMRRLDECLASQ